MSGVLSGPGIGLGLPQNLYPTAPLSGAPYDFANNYLSLAPGDTLPLPAGSWYVNLGAVCVSQFYDAVTGIWRFANNGFRAPIQYIQSDGFNARVANLTGCPVAAVVTNAGTGYVQATTTCVAGSGNSTWYPIVGGLVSVTTILNAGSGYGITPLVFIPAPPAPGVQATAYATLTSNTVSGITFINQGAGYTSAPVAAILPNPTDPNLGVSAIVNATVTLGTFGAGSIAAILCTNPGTSLTAAPSLTIAGAGASATATALRMLTINGATVFGAGVGFTGGALAQAIGSGSGATAVNTNPAIESTDFLDRPAAFLLAAPVGASLASVSTIYDGGLFVGATPSLVINGVSGSIPTTGASVVALMGGINDTVLLQPAP